MRDIFLSSITYEQRDILNDMIEQDDKESSYQAKIILMLKDEGHTVPEIRMMATNHHDVNIRRRIHRFNEKGIKGIIFRKHTHKPIKISYNIEKKIGEISTVRIQETVIIYHFQYGHYLVFLQDTHPRN